MALLVAAVALLYVLHVTLAVLVIVLYRQFGLVYVGSRRSHEMVGPPVGARAPSGLKVFSTEDAEVSLALDWSTVQPGGVTLLLLGGDACPLCDHLLHHLDEDWPTGLDSAG